MNCKIENTVKLVFIFLMIPFIGSSQVDTLALKTVKGITDKMLEIISGEIGDERDWDAFENLFFPGAQLVFPPPSHDKMARAMTISEFIEKVGPSYAKDGFEESRIGYTEHQFNGIAIVFQSFTCRNLTGTYDNRGINGYQLIFAEDRWWITSCVFSNESDKVKIPEHFLD